MGPDGLHPALPFRLSDNADSPLDLSDLVLLDPVATGFSHAVTGSTTDQFTGAQNDAESVATFVRDFLDRFHRRASPLYLLGESYGGIRGSLVAQLVQLPLYLPLKGLILISPWLSISSTDFTEDDNLVPYFTYFPSYAATAWYHRRAAARYLAMPVGDVFQAAKTFAFGPYRQALELGNEISPQERHAIALQMSDFTGLSPEWLEHLNLRVKDADFASGLLYDQNEQTGLYDARFVGRRLSRQTGAQATDPSDTGTGFPFVSAVNAYLRDELGFQTPYPYVDSANLVWPYNSDGMSFVATHNLSQAFADNPALEVFVASGYYDLVCPMGTVEYERSMLDPASQGHDRMAIHRYESGHMVYINPAALHQLKADLTGFYAATAGGAPVLTATAPPALAGSPAGAAAALRAAR
jgi:carboxypeptidase C (cathepsin A)